MTSTGSEAKSRLFTRLAIKAPGRADIFMGIGDSAEILAGGQYAEGRLYYLFLKPQYVDQYAPEIVSASRGYAIDQGVAIRSVPSAVAA